MTDHPWSDDFHLLLRGQIEGSSSDERLIFIDTDDKIREVIYAPGFESGTILFVYQHLKALGELKAVLHVSSNIYGPSDDHGRRTSVVEYLPDGKYYGFRYKPVPSTWVKGAQEDEEFLESMKYTQHLLGEEEGQT